MENFGVHDLVMGLPLAPGPGYEWSVLRAIFSWSTSANELSKSTGQQPHVHDLVLPRVNGQSFPKIFLLWHTRCSKEDRHARKTQCKGLKVPPPPTPL